MSYSLNDDPRQIQDLIRRVAKEKVAARAEAIDRTAEYPEDMYALLKERARAGTQFSRSACAGSPRRPLARSMFRARNGLASQSALD